MTREEAIDLLDNLIGMIEDNHESDYDTALKMAIKALEFTQNILKYAERITEENEKNHFAYIKIANVFRADIETIQALSQEPSGDAVSRQAVLDYIHRILNQGTGKKKSFEFIQKYVEKQPPVKPQESTGHWILSIEDWNKWTCSECGYSERTDIHVSLGYDYCPKCGERMIEPQESEVCNG